MRVSIVRNSYYTYILKKKNIRKITRERDDRSVLTSRKKKTAAKNWKMNQVDTISK